MQPTVSPATKIQTYATRFPRLTPIELSKLTGERPATVREALAHLARR